MKLSFFFLYFKNIYRKIYCNFQKKYNKMGKKGKLLQVQHENYNKSKNWIKINEKCVPVNLVLTYLFFLLSRAY